VFLALIGEASVRKCRRGVIRSDDKKRHVIVFSSLVMFADFQIRDFDACDAFVKEGKKGAEVVRGISFKGTERQLRRVRRRLVHNQIEFILISSSVDENYKKIWREHSSMHPLLGDLKRIERAAEVRDVA